MPEAQLYPGARWHPLGAQTERRMTGHDILCYHTMVGYLISTDRYFRISNGEAYSGTESHYGVGGPWGPDLGGGLDGAVWQWQDRAFGANANLDGYRTVISIETADNAPKYPQDIAAWSDRQVEALIDIGVWECSPAAHAKCPSSWTCHGQGIPPVLIPDTKPGRRGIGYHRQGCDPYRDDGGVRWSSSYGKVCPGARRIAQLGREIVPEIRRRLAGGAPTTGGLHMDTDVSKAFTNLDGKLDRLLASNTRVEARLGPLVTAVGAQGDDETKALAAIKDAKTAVLAGLAALPTAALSEADVQRLGHAIAEMIPSVQADAVIDALGVRITGEEAVA